MSAGHVLAPTDVVVDGLRLSVAEHGAGSPVLLLHGVPTTGYLWHDVAWDLGRHHRLVIPDLVGLGGSEKPIDPARYSLAAQAVTVLHLLDALGLERVAVVGHDVGGTVAAHLAALAPGRVIALGLLTSLLHQDVWPVQSAVPFTLPGINRITLRGLRSALGPAMLRRAMGASMTDTEIAHYLAAVRSPEGGSGLLRFFRMIDAAPTEALLPDLAAVPTLVLWGEQDIVHSVAYGRRVAAALPGSTFVPVTGGGHLLPTEHPERVAEELQGFLAGIGAAA